MLIYLDANIVQYCADFGDLLFAREGARHPTDRKLETELLALAQIIEVAVRAEEQDSDHRLDIAVSGHLLDELHRGRPTPEQLDTYHSLRGAWRDLGVEEHGSPDVEVVNSAERTLRKLHLKKPADRRHLAEAVAIGAKWFLTHDKDILDKTRDGPSLPGMSADVIVARPSRLWKRDGPSQPEMTAEVIVARPSELWKRIVHDPVFGLRVGENGLTAH